MQRRPKAAARFIALFVGVHPFVRLEMDIMSARIASRNRRCGWLLLLELGASMFLCSVQEHGVLEINQFDAALLSGHHSSRRNAVVTRQKKALMDPLDAFQSILQMQVEALIGTMKVGALLL
jgi:hypothetical protein